MSTRISWPGPALTRVFSWKLGVLAALLSSACVTTEKIAADAPTAKITSHSDADQVEEGDEVSFEGRAFDTDHEMSELSVSWYLEWNQVCAPATPDADGTSACTATVGEGGALRMEVRDPTGGFGFADVSLDVIATEPPEVEISSPVPTGVYYSDVLVQFEGEVGDAEDDADDLEIIWTSDVDGELDIDTNPDYSGDLEGSSLLSQGLHVISLAAVDTSGKSAATSVTIEVGPPNSAPECEIVTPSEDFSAPLGEDVEILALASDVDVSAKSLLYDWSSDLDGTLDVGNVESDGSIQLLMELSQGIHTITLTVADDQDESCTDSIGVGVGKAPTVSITVPSEGDVVNEGAQVSFVGIVADEYEAAEGLAIEWSSDVDGVLDGAAADEDGVTSFESSELTRGTHLVTLTATNSVDLMSVDEVKLVINGAP
ncbi:MAG: hypothetical protein QGG40_12025, partial [Myxococcota bacterium]|nr:hypothetical protein [Myxococcota bacterium]